MVALSPINATRTYKEAVMVQQLIVSQLLSRGTPTVSDKPWSAVSGAMAFDGSVIRLTASKRARRRVLDAIDRDDGNRPVIWVPRSRPPSGRLTRSLDWGNTVVVHDGHLVSFQSVIFVREQAIDTIAEFPEGRFVQLPMHYVSAWDGTSLNDRAPPCS